MDVIGNGLLHPIGSTVGITSLSALYNQYPWATNPLAGLTFPMTVSSNAATGTSSLTFIDRLTGINNWQANAAHWLNPAFGNCLLVPGMSVTAQGLNATLLSFDSDPASPTYGQVFLSAPTTAPISAGTPVQFTLPDSAIAGLSADWLAIQNQLFQCREAQFSKPVALPSGSLILNRTLLVPSYVTDTSGMSGAVRITGGGSGGMTRLYTQSDLGRGHALIKEVNRSGQNSAFLELENIYLRNLAGTMVFGTAPAQMDLLTVGAKAKVIRCRGFGGRAGIAMTGDHQIISQCDFRCNGYNVMFDDFTPTIGDQTIEDCDLTGCLLASIGIAATNMMAPVAVRRVHTGFGVRSIYKEPATAQVTNSLGAINNLTLDCVAVESVGLGFIGGPGANNQIANIVGIAGGCGQTKFNSAYAPAGQTPVAMITCASMSGFVSTGFDFDPVGSGYPAIQTSGNLSQCQFNGCPELATSTAIPFVCGGYMAAMKFDCALGRGKWLTANVALAAGMPGRESENSQALPYSASYPFAGVIGATVKAGQSVPIWTEAMSISVVKADPTVAISGGPAMSPAVGGFVPGSPDWNTVGYAVSGSAQGAATINMALV